MIIVFTALLGLLTVFQIALAAGAPLGAFAWGGQHQGSLPGRLRVASSISVLICLLIAAIMLDRAEVVEWLPRGVSAIAAWMIFAYFILATIMNLVSRSPKERAVMSPLAALLAASALLIQIGY